MKMHQLFLKTLPAVMAFIALSASADLDNEREQLASISNELALLQERVLTASKTADSTGRVRFQYEWLAKDLELVRRGVDDHLDAPRQPRVIPPLKGDYRR
jgi:RAQPRD family integrative conjugative element protein